MAKDYNEYIITNFNVVLLLVIHCVNMFFVLGLVSHPNTIYKTDIKKTSF